MRAGFLSALFELAENDSHVMLVTGDLGFSVFEQFEEQYPSQYLNVGVAEQNMIGVAAGLALEGKKIFAYSIGNFPTLRCLEHLRNDVCYHELNVNVVASGGGFSYGALGMSHHATEDISIMRAMPGATVIAPATAWEAKEATKALYNIQGMGYLRLDKSKVEGSKERLARFSIGKANQLRSGDGITLIGAGGVTEEAMRAADQLSNDGIECRVLSMCTLKPIDVNAIRRACSETAGIITIEENNLIGGLGSCVAEVCMDKNLKPKNFKRLGIKDEYSSIVGSQGFLRSVYQLDNEEIVSTVKEIFANNSHQS